MLLNQIPILISLFAMSSLAHEEESIHLHMISKKMPESKSDFSATYFDGAIEGSSAENKSSRSIILLGGCSAENGNVYIENEGFYCNTFSSTATIFFPETHEFGSMPDMPEARTRHTAAAVDGKLYVIGGRDGEDKVLANIIQFDPETQKWSTFIELTSMYALSDHGSVVRDGKIYVFGGYNEDYSIVKSKTFSIDTRDGGKIEDLTSMLTARGDVAAVRYDHGKIDAAYLIGGFNGDNNFCAPLPTVERYDFKSNEWTESTSDEINLSSERGDKAAVVMDKVILTIGGEDKHEDMCEKDASELDPFTHSVGVKEVEVLDPRDKTPRWKYATDLPDIRFRAAAALDKKSNTLYFFGGQKAFDNDCKCYKTASDVYSYQGATGGLSTTAIVLISVGCVLFVATAAFFMRKRTRKDPAEMGIETHKDSFQNA